MALESKFDNNVLKLPLNEELLKQMTRMGIPETKKSEFLRKVFNLNKNRCHFDYIAAKKSAG